MGYRFTVDDVAFLQSAAGSEALRAADLLDLTDRSRMSDVDRLRRRVGQRHAAAVLETAVLRRRAESKLDTSQRWLLTDDALQQATPSAVAAHRAQRLHGRAVHDLTCSIGADVIAASRAAELACGSDLDRVRLAMAAHNAAAEGRHVALAQADALAPVSRGAVLLADPSRRDSAGRRRWRPSDFVPSLDELARACAGRDLVVKAAPGLDPAVAPWAAEVELVSLDGSVREASLWSPGLATSGVGRRASVLSSRRPPWTVTDADPDDAGVREVGEWVVDPDGAVIRAGLVRQYAARHGLGQLDPRIAYLTGHCPPPGTRAFRVLEHGRYSEKALRSALRRHDAGTIEILVRGLDVDPAALRKRLRPQGRESLSVVLTRIGRAPTALLCRAERIG